MAEEEVVALEPEPFHLNSLPNEILMEILENLDAVVLELVCSRVCERWKELCDKIVSRRTDNLERVVPASVLKEMRTKLPSTLKSDKLSLLKYYERTFMSSKVEIKHEFCESNFIRKIFKKRACDCDDIDVCLTRVIHFMPCHKLLLVQIPEQIYYFHETDPFQSQKDIDLEPYGTYTDAPGVEIRVDNNTHAAVSVYHDRVVVQETPRVLMLFRIQRADHEDRRVKIERIRRIFLPIWSCALALHDRKVFVLFTTGYLGVWHEEQDALVISDNKCGSSHTVETMRLTVMHRCNNLIFVKLISTSNEINWTLVDATEAAINLHSVPLVSLVNTFCMSTSKEECVQVHQLNAWNNVLILHCKISDGNTSESKILVARMKQELKRDHFLSQQTFQDLFHEPNRNSVMCLTFHGSVTAPFPSPRFSASMIGIQKSLQRKLNRRRVYPLFRIDFENP